jgi:hypothetical protein
MRKRPLKNYLLKKSSLLLPQPLLRKRKRKEIGGRNQTIHSITMILKPFQRKMSLKTKKKSSQNNQNSRQHLKRTMNLKSSSVFK